MNAVDTDLDLYRCGVATAVACWTSYARAIPGADVHRLPDVDVAVFTDGPDPGDFHLALGRLDGDPVATGTAFDHDGDTGVYNVGTLERARRRGLGSAVVGVLLRDAVARGARTATLQSTGIARGVYARQGFRDLGRILGLAPPPARP